MNEDKDRKDEILAKATEKAEEVTEEEIETTHLIYMVKKEKGNNDSSDD